MAEILFVTWDGGGNVPPALGIARELRARGHTVRFLGHRTQAAAARRGRLRAVATAPRADVSSTASDTPARHDGRVRRPRHGARPARRRRARPADLVVVDCLMFGALDAGAAPGCATSSSSTSTTAYYEQGCLRGPLGLSLPLRRLRPARRWPRRRPVRHDGARARSRQRPRRTWTRPARSSRSHRSPRRDAPHGAGQPEHLRVPGMRRPCSASSTHRAGSAPGAWSRPAPRSTRRPAARAGVEVHRFVPHGELMPRASLLVGHGGHGTTMQALAHDLPVLVMPMDRYTDQPMVGPQRRGRPAPAGWCPRGATADELAPVIAELLADGPHRAAAARLGAAIREQPGAPAAPTAVEALLRDGAAAPGRPAARP